MLKYKYFFQKLSLKTRLKLIIPSTKLRLILLNISLKHLKM